MTDTSTAPTAQQSEGDIRAAVLAAIVDLAPAPDGPHELDSSLVDDLGYHSLALLELAFALEDEFDLEPIDEETARRITTVRLVQDTVVERLREQAERG